MEAMISLKSLTSFLSPVAREQPQSRKCISVVGNFPGKFFSLPSITWSIKTTSKIWFVSPFSHTMKLLRCASLLLVQTRASRVSAVAYQRRNSALKEAPVERLENGNVQNVYSAVVPPVEKRIPVSLPKNTFVPSGETNHLQRQQWIVQDRLPLPTLLTSEDQNVWKDIPATTLTTSLDHYAKLSKIKLTGNVVIVCTIW